MRRKVSGRTKTEVYANLDKVRQELAQGIRSSSTYTVAEASKDWLTSLTDRADKTVQTQRELLAPLLADIGKRVLRQLEAMMSSTH